MRTGILWLGIAVLVIGLAVAGVGWYYNEIYSESAGAVLAVLGLIGGVAGYAMKKTP